MPPEGRYNFRHYGPVPLSFDPVRHLPWTYQGWQGQVYTRQYPENKFVQECLREYCQYEYQGGHCSGPWGTMRRSTAHRPRINSGVI